MRTDCDDVWFTSRAIDAAVRPIASALAGPRASAALGGLATDGLRVWLFVIEPGPPGAVRLLGRLRVGRRWRPVEVRVEPWSQRCAALRLAPAHRGIRRKPPGRAFYASADGVLARLDAVLAGLLAATDEAPTFEIAA